jgi:hypothetical protein
MSDGKFKEGNPGKPKGAVNKSTRIVKEVFADVFDKLQGDKKANLLKWAKANPTEFYKLSAKLIPIQLAGDPDNPVAVNMTEGLTFEQLYQLKYGRQPDK